MSGTHHPRRLPAFYRRLLAAYGPQGWWPGQSPFEVMVGAILTQNTAWTNVEKAITQLKEARCLSPEAMLALDLTELARLIQPSGYFNVKARRLRAFCHWYVLQGGLARLRKWPTQRLRSTLLSLHGVGPETADDILLYALDRPVFVVDAYTRRIFLRYGILGQEAGYEEIRSLVEAVFGEEVAVYNELHALIVRHAKAACRSRPACSDCVVRDLCNHRASA